MICDLCEQNVIGSDESHVCATTALFRQEDPEKEFSFSERLAFGFAMHSNEDVAGIDLWAHQYVS